MRFCGRARKKKISKQKKEDEDRNRTREHWNDRISDTFNQAGGNILVQNSICRILVAEESISLNLARTGMTSSY